ncbi:MAG: extracellular solute-binding protein [Deltaproteobacteria bacterium]|nr:extracellular solute-binding protein [Deltaproteobacteria bacterium]
MKVVRLLAVRAVGCWMLGVSVVGFTLVPTTGASQEPEKEREARLIDAAKKDGALIFWNQSPAKESETMLAKFRNRYPFLRTEYWRAGSTALFQKQITEGKAGVHNFDIGGTDLDYVEELKKAGLMKKYHWPSTGGWPASQKDTEGYWVTRLRSLKVIAYNTQLVPPNQLPKRWENLLDPKWKGKIQIDKDSADWVLMLWSAWGKEKAISFLKQLSRNVVLSGNQSQRLELLAAGAIPIDMAISLHRLVQYQDKGAPLEFARTDPAVLEKSTPIFIAQHAPHPNAAILFADWFTSLEGQQAYYDTTLSPVPDPRVKTRFAEPLKGLKVAVTPADIAVHSNEAEKIFRDIFWK